MSSATGLYPPLLWTLRYITLLRAACNIICGQPWSSKEHGLDNEEQCQAISSCVLITASVVILEIMSTQGSGREEQEYMLETLSHEWRGITKQGNCKLTCHNIQPHRQVKRFQDKSHKLACFCSANSNRSNRSIVLGAHSAKDLPYCTQWKR